MEISIELNIMSWTDGLFKYVWVKRLIQSIANGITDTKG